MKRATPSQKLLFRLKAECGLTLGKDAKIIRTRFEKSRIEQGAWKWYLYQGKEMVRHKIIGSPYTVAELLKCRRIHIVPDGSAEWDTWAIEPKD